MTVRLGTLAEIAARFHAIVLDQWGVLHDGTTAYPNALDCLGRLGDSGVCLAVLSNSGKRAAPNLERIAGMGFARDLFETVMTSGEALWQDISSGNIPERVFCPIERTPGDAAGWAGGLDVTLTSDPGAAEAILLMGLPDDAADDGFAGLLDAARARGLPVICTNPDRASPRADGQTVTSPGTLAHAFAETGGEVRFYGKPHLPVFRALETALAVPPERMLMVGDSLEHDIAGGAAAGWSTAFVESGLHADAFAKGDDPLDVLTRLARAENAPDPDFSLATLR